MVIQTSIGDFGSFQLNFDSFLYTNKNLFAKNIYMLEINFLPKNIYMLVNNPCAKEFLFAKKYLYAKIFFV